MKVIDLLNKIANGEEVPNKIKWGLHEFKYRKLNENDKYYFCEEGINSTLEHYLDFSDLHEEVEIIEEDKKIEKIKDQYCSQISKVELAQKINEIIDKINGGVDKE